jgi:hypothetical protein
MRADAPPFERWGPLHPGEWLSMARQRAANLPTASGSNARRLRTAHGPRSSGISAGAERPGHPQDAEVCTDLP